MVTLLLQFIVGVLAYVSFVYALYLMACGILGIPLTEGARRQKEEYIPECGQRPAPGRPAPPTPVNMLPRLSPPPGHACSFPKCYHTNIWRDDSPPTRSNHD